MTMGKLKVLLTAEADAAELTPLEPYCEIEPCGWYVNETVLSEDELIEKLAGKDVLVTSYDVVSRKVIENTKLQLIVCTRATPVNVDVAAAKEHGVPVVYTPGRNSDATAEFAVALLLSIARKIPFAYDAIKSCKVCTDDDVRPGPLKKDVTWGKVKETRPYSYFKGTQLKNKTVGICGYGSIGKKVGKILSAFGMYVLVYDPYVARIDIDAPGFRKVDFETLLKESDFITCHMKVTDSTRGMFNAEAFAKMKPTAYFINDSRGAVTDEPALIEALRNHTIAGAALDVYEYEPLYRGHPFVSGELDNVVLTPHIGGAAADSITNHTQMFVDEIIHFAKGEPLIYTAK